jgi:hypothetical protein
VHPSPLAIASIRAKVTDWTPSDATIAASLNTPSIANPTPQGQIAAPVYESELLGTLTDQGNGSLVKLINWPNFGLLKADIEIQNRAGIGLWCQALTLAGYITQGEASAIVTYLGSAVADPSYQTLLSWAQVNLGRPVDADDITASRPGA